MIKKILFSDIFCLYIAILCQIYIKFYQNILYYSTASEFFMICYQYIVFPLFFLCILKPIGSIISKKLQLKTPKNKFYNILKIVILLYFIFIILVEIKIIEVVFIVSSIRFFVYSIFGITGFIFGICFKNNYN